MLISLPMSQFGLVAAVPESVKSIDLGLPSGTMWANMNIGASSMIEYGGYYAWGRLLLNLIYSFRKITTNTSTLRMSHTQTKKDL